MLGQHLLPLQFYSVVMMSLLKKRPYLTQSLLVNLLVERLYRAEYKVIFKCRADMFVLVIRSLIGWLFFFLVFK